MKDIFFGISNSNTKLGITIKCDSLKSSQIQLRLIKKTINKIKLQFEYVYRNFINFSLLMIHLKILKMISKHIYLHALEIFKQN